MALTWAESYLGKVRASVGDGDTIFFVGARTVVLDEQNRLLLIQRSDNRRWAIPAGAMELGESMEECAVRELWEETGLKAGTYKGKAVQNAYGTMQVTIKVSGGKVTAADSTYPTDGFSGTINPNAVKTLNASALKAQSADVDAVSGATFTSQSYVTSLQSALDKAGA